MTAASTLISNPQAIATATTGSTIATLTATTGSTLTTLATATTTAIPSVGLLATALVTTAFKSTASRASAFKGLHFKRKFFTKKINLKAVDQSYRYPILEYNPLIHKIHYAKRPVTFMCRNFNVFLSLLTLNNLQC